MTSRTGYVVSMQAVDVRKSETQIYNSNDFERGIKIQGSVRWIDQCGRCVPGALSHDICIGAEKLDPGVDSSISYLGCATTSALLEIRQGTPSNLLATLEVMQTYVSLDTGV